MPNFLRVTFSGFAFAIMASIVSIQIAAAPAQAQIPGTNPALQMYRVQGFTPQSIETFAETFLGTTTASRSILPNGSEIVRISPADGSPYVVWPDFANDQGVFMGLVFAKYYSAADYRATPSELNAFSISRPHGNATFIPSSNTFIVQRLITNFAGMTNGALTAEFGVFEGYSETFTGYLASLQGTGAIASAASQTDGGKISQPANRAAPSVETVAATIKAAMIERAPIKSAPAMAVGPFSAEMAMSPESVLNALLDREPRDTILNDPRR